MSKSNITFKVSNSAELKIALNNVKEGGSIVLSAGDYSDVRIQNKDFGKGITITSADPANKAVLNDLYIRNVSGVTIQGVDLHQSSAQELYTFTVYGSSNIVLDNLKVSGPETGALSIQENAPVMIRMSENVTVSNSEFENARYGLSLLDNTGVKVIDNYFHDIRTDGVRGGGNSNLTISRNIFTDFHPGSGDHPDAVQLWTSNQTKAASGIVISSNLIARGDGEAMQGIFIRDEVGNLPFKDLKIEGNIVAGGMINGISVQGISSGSVTGNTVIALDGEKSWIRVNGARDVVLSNNYSTGYTYDNPSGISNIKNTDILGAQDSGAGAVNNWLTSHGIGKNWAGDSASVLAMLDLKMNASSRISDNDRWTEIRGTDDFDRLTVESIGNSRIVAGAGNDFLYGSTLGNQHQLMGGTGNDTYFVYSNKDGVVEKANEGTDLIAAYTSLTLADNVENVSAMVGKLTINGNFLDNRLTGSDDVDTFYGLNGDDTFVLGGGNDKGYGGNGDDTLNGGSGNDLLDGGSGADKLYGGEGNDTLIGGDGNDLLEGGAGQDTFTGGAGSDEFRFRPGDLAKGQTEIITDFKRGADIISLSLIDANSKTVANDKFTFIGTQGFHKVAGELNYTVANGAALVSGDVNGDGIADFTIQLLQVTNLTSSDFLL